MTFQAAAMTFQGYDERMDHQSFVLADDVSPGSAERVGRILITDGGYAFEALIALRERVRRDVSSHTPLVDALEHARSTVSTLLEAERMRPGEEVSPAWSNPLSAVACTLDGDMRLAWIGAVRVVLVRNGEVVRSAEPHLTKISAHGAKAEIVTRQLGDPTAVPDSTVEPWTLSPGDRILYCTENLWQILGASPTAAIVEKAPLQAVLSTFATRLVQAVSSMPRSGVLVIASVD